MKTLEQKKKHAEYMTHWRKDNPEKVAKSMKDWRINNYKKWKVYRAKYDKERPWIQTYRCLTTRCKNSPKYIEKGITNYLHLKDLKFLWFRDKAYLLTKPSIDRIDNDGNYTLDNCRYIEHNENARRGSLGISRPQWVRDKISLGHKRRLEKFK